MKITRLIFFVICLLTGISSFASFASVAKQSLIVGLLVGSKEQRDIYHDLARKFEKEHPGIQVKFLGLTDKKYKANLMPWLTAKQGPDLLYAQAGEFLFHYARLGLLDPINELWQRNSMDEYYPPRVQKLVSIDKQIYGLPMSYYTWGFYYKKSLFDKFNLQPPKTWQQFLAVCQTLKFNGISPIILGTKEHWPTAGWFDYLDLRLNGLAFHQQLMSGSVPYTDIRVRKVFMAWKQLIDRKYFHQSFAHWDWKQGLPLVFRDLAAMSLLGSFLPSYMPDSVRNDIGFFQFPRMNQEIDMYEEAPLDIFMLPKNAQNKKAAEKFLSFISRPNIQNRLNNKLRYLSPNMQSPLASDHFLRMPAEILAQAKGFSQFYDRDTSKTMAEEGLKIFSTFMKTADVETTVQALEAVRKRVF